MAPSESSKHSTSPKMPEPQVDESNTAVLNPYDIYTQPVIQIVLETDTGPVNFHVHKALLTRHSKWFRNELAGLGLQSGNKIKLEDVGTDVFVIFLEWLYKQELEPVIRWVPAYRIVSRFYPDEDILAAYIFADRFSISGFKSVLLKLAVLWFNDEAPGNYAICEAFKHLPASSTFLQLLVDATCRNRNLEDFDPDVGDVYLPPSFLIRVAKVYAQIAGSAGQAVELHEVDYTSD